MALSTAQELASKPIWENQKSKEAEYTNVLKDLYDERRFTASSEENKRKLALLYGNAIGISSATDDLNIYNLSGNVKDKNNYRDITLAGNQLRIVARNSPFAKSKLDKDFMVKQKFGNEFKTFAVDDKTGALGYYTNTQLENNKDLTIYTFDTDMDLKAYFSGGLLDSQINFNTGGGGYSNTPETVKGYINKVRNAESGGNDRAKSPTSSATGRYQFTQSTWKNVEKALNKDLDKYNPNHQEIAMEWLTTQNSNYLKQKGIPLNNGNLYMVHFLGQGGASRFFKALQENPNAPATSFATKEEYEANKEIFNRVKTVQDLYNFMTKKVS